MQKQKLKVNKTYTTTNWRSSYKNDGIGPLKRLKDKSLQKNSVFEFEYNVNMIIICRIKQESRFFFVDLNIKLPLKLYKI